MPSVAGQISSCQLARRVWASSYSRNSRTRPQSRDSHFRSQELSRTERRRGKMKRRIEVSLKNAWMCALTVGLLAASSLSPGVWAQQEPAVEDQTANLQKATQNPVASLISVPLQNNTNFGANPGYRNQNVLNIQPVIPIGITKDWNLLVRWITPIIYHSKEKAPAAIDTLDLHFGLMD